MRKLFLLMSVGVLFFATPLLANAAEAMKSVTGSIQGYECVMHNQVCPIGMEDAEAAAENVLVLLVNAEKADYYMIPNVSKEVLARHINEQIKVVGYIDNKRNTIWAEEIYKGAKMVWSNKMQQERKGMKGHGGK
jgi:hypothetical protein